MKTMLHRYPAHPWFSGWTIEPRGCAASFREAEAKRFFKTTDQLGTIAPNVERPDWSLRVELPAESRVTLLFNGFGAIRENKRKRVAVEALTPEAGVLWGRFEGSTAPKLISESPTEQDQRGVWLEERSESVLLEIRDDRFCLVSKHRLREDASRLADRYLSADFADALSNELDRRSGAAALFEDMAHHDALAVISAESMMKALRPAEGKIPLAWSQSSAHEEPRMDVNEIAPLALAWRLMAPETAEELLLCALKIQTNAGAIPVLFAPQGTHSVLEAPKPILAKTVETVWGARENMDFLTTALPPLRRHIQWLLHHFDPKRAGLHAWKNSNEPIVPREYESDHATVDLSVLLLTEIEAYNRLRARTAESSEEPYAFQTERDLLKRNILEVFWDDRTRAFSNSISRDRVGTLEGFASFAPLLWGDLPLDRREGILDSVKESGRLPSGPSVLSWRKSAMDDDSFPLAQQLYVLQALHAADPHGQSLSDFSRVTLEGFVEWHTLSLRQEGSVRVTPVVGAFIMSVQALRQYRYHAQGAVTGRLFRFFRRYKADRFDLFVIIATLFAVVSVRLIYSVANAPPPFDMLDADLNAAYADRDAETAFAASLRIIKHHPEQADRARLLAANILQLRDRPAPAAEFYEIVRANHPDSPGPMIALGLAYQLQGRFAEAEENYFEFCYLFDEIFPDLVAEVNRYRYLAKEEFKAPPKWREMYGYAILHEL